MNFDVCDFRFVIVPDHKTRSLGFRIQYVEKGDSNNALLLDTVDTWIQEVHDKIEQNNCTAEEVVDMFRRGVWIDLKDGEYGFRTYWKKNGYTVDEDGFNEAVEQYFTTLTALAYGIECANKENR